MDKTLKIFVDFDGTITKIDVGEAFGNRFGNKEKNDEVIAEWIDGKVSSTDVWKIMLQYIQPFNQKDFDEFISRIEIDETFVPFVQFCRQNNFGTMVLSDGFDLYIKKILEREGLADVQVYCNKLSVNDKNEYVLNFPYGDEECKLCGNCKRNHILSHTADEDFIIYIGDGYSDKCPIQFCDFIFAKGALLKYCEINRITYFPFENFNDIAAKLTELNSKKRLKKKFQAQVNRKNVFESG